MFWYCIILDVMFVLAPLALFVGVVVFVWAEERRDLAAVVTGVVVVVVIQWVFRVFMVFTCLWKFGYVKAGGRRLDMPIPPGWAGGMV